MNVPYDLTSYVRVLKLASTPDWEEFSQIAKIAGAGILWWDCSASSSSL